MLYVQSLESSKQCCFMRFPQVERHAVQILCLKIEKALDSEMNIYAVQIYTHRCTFYTWKQLHSVPLYTSTHACLHKLVNWNALKYSHTGSLFSAIHRQMLGCLSEWAFTLDNFGLKVLKSLRCFNNLNMDGCPCPCSCLCRHPCIVDSDANLLVCCLMSLVQMYSERVWCAHGYHSFQIFCCW